LTAPSGFFMTNTLDSILTAMAREHQSNKKKRSDKLVSWSIRYWAAHFNSPVNEVKKKWHKLLATKHKPAKLYMRTDRIGARVSYE